MILCNNITNNFSYKFQVSNLQKYILFLFLLILSFPAYSQNYQRIIPLDSDIYTIIDNIYLEQGLSRPSTTRPWSEDELIHNLDRIAESELSKAGRKGLEIIRKTLHKEDNSKKISFHASADINIEGYLKYTFSETKTDDIDYEWMHGYEERLPLINIPLEVELGNYFYSDLELIFKDEPNVLDEYENKITNIIINPMHINLQMPFRTFVAGGNKNWNIQLGRDKLSWGNGTTGNMMLADRSEYYDFIKASTWWNRFKFTTVYASLEPWLTEEETAAYGDYVETKEGINFENELYKAFFGHRLEFFLSRKLNIAISESVIFGRKYPDLQDFNPVMIFHNWYIEEQANSLATAEINYAPVKNLILYGQLAVDQFQTSSEKASSSSANEMPNAYGLLAGIKGGKAVTDGFLTGNFEWAYTNPWLYTGTHPLLSYTSRWRVISNIDGDSGYKLYDYPLGYYTGPDSQLFYLKIKYTVPDYYSASLETTYLQKGENTIYTEYGSGDDPTSLTTPSGSNPIHSIINKINGEIKLSSTFTAGTSFYWGWIYNADHIKGASRQSLEWVPYLKLSY